MAGVGFVTVSDRKSEGLCIPCLLSNHGLYTIQDARTRENHWLDHRITYHRSILFLVFCCILCMVMVAVIQRVYRAHLYEITPEMTRALIGEIERGLVVLVGFEKEDQDMKRLAKAFLQKIPVLRVFEDAQGRMNLSLLDRGYGLMVVPNFTLAGSVQKGRRPSFDGALAPEPARILFEHLCEELKRSWNTDAPLVCGRFGAHMHIDLINDGPVTLIWRYPSR